jgi:rRNA processing protein Gar1
VYLSPDAYLTVIKYSRYKSQKGDFLIEIGNIEKISMNGNLIARCKAQVMLNQHVYDERGKKLGRVTKIIGPVASPYALIRPEKNLSLMSSQNLIGKSIYAGEEHGRKKEESGRGRRDKKVPILRKHAHREGL